MLRQVIKIDEEKCIGCGLCANACHEKAIEIINGKAKVVKDNYCDGMGDCLPSCPAGALSFQIKETVPYDAKAVEQRKASLNAALTNWPIQIKLASINSKAFYHCDLLIAADCSGYAFADFHKKFIKNHVTLIGCSKLDATDYSEKLTMIFSLNPINSITITRMTVPCCGGLETMVKEAIAGSGKNIPLKIITFSPQGEIVNEQ